MTSPHDLGAAGGSGRTATVAVAVPSYNHASYLERCLRSVMRQTHPPAQLLVIDDGSRDESPRVAERVLRDCPFPSELVVRENRGVSATLNEALERTRGEYFAYVGSDDMWLPRRLEATVGLLERRRDAVLSHGHFLVVDANDRVIGCSLVGAPDASDIGPRDIFEARRVPSNSTVTYRRSALERYQWRAGARLEDYELYLHLVGIGPFVGVSEIVGCRRIHGTNTSGNHLMMLEETLEAQRRVAAELGFVDADLERARALTTFRFARDLNDDGARVDAARLMLRSLPGGGTLVDVGRQVAKMVLPGWVRELNRARHQWSARRRFSRLLVAAEPDAASPP